MTEGISVQSNKVSPPLNVCVAAVSDIQTSLASVLPELSQKKMEAEEDLLQECVKQLAEKASSVLFTAC